MSKFSAGLHKDVSKIFDGVAIPKRNEAEPAVSQNHNRALSSISQFGGQSGSIKKKPFSQALLKIKSKFSNFFYSAHNPRQKVMAGVMPISLIVLIWVIGRAFNPAPTSSIKAGMFDLRPIPAAPVRDKWQVPEEYPTGLRDPMQYSSAPSAKEQKHGYDKIIVRGIVYSDDHPAAIIGNEIAGVGDEVYGVTIIKINANSVEFQMNDNIWTQTVQD